MAMSNILFFLSIGNQADSIEQNVSPIWGEGATAPFSQTVSNIQTNTILAATAEGVDSYKHHPLIIKWNNEYHVMHSQHLRDEYGDGTFVNYAYSSDGLSWTSDIQLIEPQCTPAIARVKRAVWPSGWAIVNNNLYAVGTVTLTDSNVLDVGQFLGLLAVQVNANHTFGTPFWISTSPPSAIDGKPTYSEDHVTGALILSELNEIDNYPLYAYGADAYFPPQNSSAWIEPSGIKVDNYDLILWRKYPIDAQKAYIQYRVNNGNWGSKTETQIPSPPSVVSWRVLSTNNVGLMGNDTDTDRKNLFYSQANKYSLNFNIVYNVRQNVSTVLNFPGYAKIGGASYVDFIEDNGKIISVYSERKEDIVCSIFDIP